MGFHAQTPFKDWCKVDQADIVIATLEKSNSLVNRWMEEGKLADLGTVVIDELHMIGKRQKVILRIGKVDKKCWILRR